MDVARALAIGAVAGFGLGMFTALVQRAAVETSLFRAIVLAVTGSILGLLTFSLNRAPKTADQRTGIPQSRPKR